MKLLPFLAAAALLAGTSSAQAAGFYLQEQSVSALGAAHAGAAAQARDASIIYYNSAAMTALSGRQVYAGGNIVTPRADLDDRGSALLGAPAGGVDSDDPVDTALVPNFYAAYPVAQGVWIGFGFNAPFGLSTVYDESWTGRYDSIRSELETLDFQPSIALRVSERLSLGGGLDIQHADATLSSAVTNGLTEGRSEMTGQADTIGWNAGVYIQPCRNTRIGLHYRSEMRHEMEGNVLVTGVAGLNEASGIRADLNLPDIAAIGIAHDLNERWTILAQAWWYGWNDYETIQVFRDDGSEAANLTQNYQTTNNFAIGAEYKRDDRLTLRAGYQYDQSPATGEYRSTRTPDSTRHWFTGGATYDADERVSFDIGAAWLEMHDAHIDLERNGGLAAIRMEKTGGSVGILSLAVKYRF